MPERGMVDHPFGMVALLALRIASRAAPERQANRLPQGRMREYRYPSAEGQGSVAFFAQRQSDGIPTSGGNRGNGGGGMKPRKTPPTEGLVGIAMHVLCVPSMGTL